MPAVIPDKNLRLALIDEVYARVRRGDDPDRLYGLPDAPSIDGLGGDPEHVPAIEAYALALPLTDDDLAGIERLVLDGDRDIYAYAFPMWWDLGDHFEIHALDGLEACRNLARLDLGQGLVMSASLAPLTQLPALAHVSLCYTSRYPDIERLLELPALTSVWIVNVPDTAPAAWRTTLATLRDRGVVFR